MGEREYFISSNQTAGKAVLLHLSKIKGSSLQRTLSHVLQRAFAFLNVCANGATSLCAVLVHTAAVCDVINFFRCDLGDGRTGQREVKSSVNTGLSGWKRTIQN